MNTKDTPMDYKQFEGHTPISNTQRLVALTASRLREHSETVRGVIVKEDIKEAAEILENLLEENKKLSEMYANTHAKLRDLEKEFSDMKANLHRAYKGLENHKELKLELQKQKELNAELVKAAEEAMKCLRAFKEVSGLPTDDVESQNAYHKLKSLIKNPNEI